MEMVGFACALVATRQLSKVSMLPVSAGDVVATSHMSNTTTTTIIVHRVYVR